MTREQTLVKRVQKLRRKHDSDAKHRLWLKRHHLPDVVVAAWTAKVKRDTRKVEQAEAELAKYRAEHAGTPYQQLCKRLLDHRNTRFVFSSPTGGTARGGLQDGAAGKQSYVAATGGHTWINERILRGLNAMADHGVILINCIVNGSHTSGSRHYSGDAVDLDNTSPLGSARIQSIGRSYGLVKNFESSHIHLDDWG